jgi:SAM-dependent methyltransferase
MTCQPAIEAQGQKPSFPANLHVYADPAIAREYAQLDYFTPCERFLVETYVPTGAAVLDLGVGGGRTTAYLLGRTGRYLGIDYSPEMIRFCRQKFPGVDFCEADASSMPMLASESFDVIFFSFNGLDMLWPHEKRRSCISECMRLLRTGGVLVFSSHNSRSIIAWRGWDPERVRSFSRRIVRGCRTLYPAAIGAVTVAKAILAVLRSTSETVSRMARHLVSRVFWHGEGYMIDPAHPGLLTHYWTPEKAISELGSFGFQCLGVWCNEHPEKRSIYRADWYYYAFTKGDHHRETDAPRARLVDLE